MKWGSIGLIFEPSPDRWWMRSHAALPVPVPISGSIYRVFFSSRDDSNRSHVGWFDIDLDSPESVLDVSPSPVLTPGPLGHFDDHGVYAASAVVVGERIYLYTIGWNPGIRPPLFYSSIGLAISNDRGGTFEKYGSSPIMARSDFDPCLVTSPFVVLDNETWRMYYVSGYRWEEVAGKLQSHYHIKYAQSEDGLNWTREGRVCIDVRPPERNIGRAMVRQRHGSWEAWYSYTMEGRYRIGYAESRDALRWVRKDDSVILQPSGLSWDDQAQAYPYVVEHKGNQYLFYNGNSFGKDGVGLAVQEG